MTKTQQLQDIFDRIYKLNVCGEDTHKVRRDIHKCNIGSKVMIIAEAMAPEQVRLSGVNYFYRNGKIGNTGRYLEKFLQKFDHSVYPDKRNCVYHTEIVHSFPGYVTSNGKKTIRRPTSEEIRLSIESNILEDEINIIQPRLILLMGNTSYQTFYKYFLGIAVSRTLTDEVTKISNTGDYNKYQNTPVIPIQHSSGANPRFSQMLNNDALIKIIQDLLNSQV